MAGQKPFEEPNNPPPLASPVPPTTPLPYAPAVPPRSKWPRILGIIAIIWASFGILSGIWDVVVSMMPRLAGTAASQPSALPHIVQIGTDLIYMALGVLLLIGAIKLLSRRILGVRLFKLWAISELLMMVFTVTAFSQIVQGMQQQAVGGSPAPPGFTKAILIGMMCFMLMLIAAPPVFALVWFARRKIKDEVATWA